MLITESMKITDCRANGKAALESWRGLEGERTKEETAHLMLKHITRCIGVDEVLRCGRVLATNGRIASLSCIVNYGLYMKCFRCIGAVVPVTCRTGNAAASLTFQTKLNGDGVKPGE
jgi:hypothetical protein